jgi:hypothetical protein
MKKYLLLLVILPLLASCSPLSKQQRVERDMFDPKRKGQDKEWSKQKKSWVSQPKRK